jgi:Mg-chelatase subunit ChlD
MARSSMMTVTRWAGAVLAGTLLATAAELGASAPVDAAVATREAAPGGATSAISSVPAGCPQATRTAVTQALDVSKIRAEIVIIVDISYSMDSRNNNLYSTVSKLVPALLSTLAKQEPQDLVAVITMGTRQNTRVIVNPGLPSSHTWVPPTAPNSDWTDFGLAFHEAVGLFSDPPQGTNPQVGDVLLLSDGQISDTIQDDPTYGGQAPAVFATPGWKDLRKAAHNLPLQVTGFELPLTSVMALQASQEGALKDVFPNVPQLQYNRDLVTDPAQAVQEMQATTTEEVQNTRITRAVTPDSGAGVRVTWSDLPGSRGKPLDLGKPGHADAMVTVRARTQGVPLCLSSISVTSAGLPVTMRGVNLPASVQLAPGASATWHVKLTWPGGSSGAVGPDLRAVTGHLVLGATVSSPFRSVISPVDASFSYGGVLGGASPQFTATAPPVVTVVTLLVLGIPVLLLLAGLALWRTWVGGELVLATGEELVHTKRDTAEYSLRGPRRSHRIDELLGKSARLIVRGSLRRRAIKVRMKIDEQLWSSEPVWLPRGGTKDNVAGVAVRHNRHTSGKRFRWRRREEPDSRPPV